MTETSSPQTASLVERLEEHATANDANPFNGCDTDLLREAASTITSLGAERDLFKKIGDGFSIALMEAEAENKRLTDDLAFERKMVERFGRFEQCERDGRTITAGEEYRCFDCAKPFHRECAKTHGKEEIGALREENKRLTEELAWANVPDLTLRSRLSALEKVLREAVEVMVHIDPAVGDNWRKYAHAIDAARALLSDSEQQEGKK